MHIFLSKVQWRPTSNLNQEDPNIYCGSSIHELELHFQMELLNLIPLTSNPAITAILARFSKVQWRSSGDILSVELRPNKFEVL